MVFLSRIYLAKIKRASRKYLKQGFRDSLKVFVSGGTGGNGLPKFGGVGGQGGDVIAVGSDNISLQDVFKRNQSKSYTAKAGRHSSHNFILGPPGESLKFEVPVGVTVITELGKKIGEINNKGEELLLAKGGTGGNPKNGYLGTKGQAYPVIFDLKLIADVGLVGFPNAGKSTLLKAISHAKPKIASYPFTTVRPNVGIIQYKDLREISMADLPGLIEGAYANKGMGHKFLKHVERTKLLLLVVDINGFQLSPQYPHRSCLETVLLLNKELELYNKDLLEKPSMLVINKMDTENSHQKYSEIKDLLKNLTDAARQCPEEMRPENFLKFSDVVAISAKEKSDDVELVKQRLRRMLDVLAQLENDDSKTYDVYKDIKDNLSEKGPSLV
ncbi:GTP-binding protein 10 homolog [Tribolium castaneum]|uniref:GTP-binding protein 10 homolog-like Protein n=1 Tax=Tribolium castaneum TaxID=7070 RepID=D6WLE5_TRICA|nr:PREDICTED: GTP-binding protein 10 homolog [Tribolium castaneum]EFA04101.2 GTP-binding protein 10 homolog-like Protein [Tribolium castaneum]|eukprot:XP_015835775.1 PREDICTED: GTP-binding protein 10 homolog [Tribolium castaneum]